MGLLLRTVAVSDDSNDPQYSKGIDLYYQHYVIAVDSELIDEYHGTTDDITKTGMQSIAKHKPVEYRAARTFAQCFRM